jgi:hypothetical protein
VTRRKRTRGIRRSQRVELSQLPDTAVLPIEAAPFLRGFSRSGLSTLVVRSAPGTALLVLATPTVLLLADLVVRHQEMASWFAPRWFAYALSAVVDALCFWLGFSITRHVWQRSRRAALVLVGLGAGLMSVWVVTSFVYYALFQGYPTWSDMVFVTEEGGHVAETWGLFAPFLDLAVCSSIVFGALVLHTLWRAALFAAANRPARPLVSLATALAVVGLLVPRAAMSDTSAASASGSLALSSTQLIR